MNRLWRAGRAYSVHLYTATGILCSLAALLELFEEPPDPRRVFAWLALAVLIDATDGPLARLWQVKRFAPRIDGRAIDDIVDYLNFTFVPLLLIWRMEWLAAPAGLWIGAALLASLLGFANLTAKQEDEGFFLGFPSYWNIVAFYIGLAAGHVPRAWTAGGVLALAVLTVLPVRFIYPNLAPHPWRGAVLGAAFGWFAMLVAMLPSYPSSPLWLIGLSLVYPVFYVVLSVVLDYRARNRSR